MSVHVTCKNCGTTVPWMSGHACRITTPGFMAVEGPGFRVRPIFHEVRNLNPKGGPLIGNAPSVGRKTERVVEYDRTITDIARERGK